MLPLQCDLSTMPVEEKLPKLSKTDHFVIVEVDFEQIFSYIEPFIWILVQHLHKKGI